MSVEYFDRESLDNWFRDKGDETHRLEYDLNEESIVFDVGGYEGEWSEKIYNRYKSNIYIFEPVKKYFDLISNKFENNQKFNVFNYAILNDNTETFITNDSASSSLFIEGEFKERVIVKNINDVINDTKVEKIDLLKINIEGGEYELMNSLTDDNIEKISNFQIQFHKIGENYDYKRESIRTRLSKTHILTYDYKFVWENWKKII
jgi:FkbM family methyltransferase